MGNERIHIDEDFAKITIRHHAVDKTYQHAPLIPNQVFLHFHGWELTKLDYLIASFSQWDYQCCFILCASFITRALWCLHL